MAVIGIATKDALLQNQGYMALLGHDSNSWGWNLVDNHLLHNGNAQGNYPLLNNAPKYQVGERIRVILDCDDNTLSFEKKDEFLGVAFRGRVTMSLLLPTFSSVNFVLSVIKVYRIRNCIPVCLPCMVIRKFQWFIWGRLWMVNVQCVAVLFNVFLYSSDQST